MNGIIDVCREDKKSTAGLIIIGLYVVIAIIGPYVTPYDPGDISFKKFQPPSLTHLMGTDDIGRDLFSRIIYGTRVSMIIVFISVTLSLGVGVFIGAVAGYYGGAADSILSRVTEAILTIPRLSLMIVVLAIFGRNIIYTVLVIGLTIWPPNARLMRAQVLSLKNRPFVEGAIAAGGRGFYVLVKHVMPNGLGPVLVNSSLQMAEALLIEASLSFIGLGDPEHISWGFVLYEGRRYLGNAWWISTFAGLPIFIVSCTCMLLNDLLASRLRPSA